MPFFYRTDGCLDKCRRNVHAVRMSSSTKPKSGKRFDSPEQEAFLNLWRTYDCLKAKISRTNCSESIQALSAQQYNALRLLRSAHPAPLQTLALGKRLISRDPTPHGCLTNFNSVSSLCGSDAVKIAASLRSPSHRRDLHFWMKWRYLFGRCTNANWAILSRTEQRDLITLLKRIREPHEENVSCDWLDE